MIPALWISKTGLDAQQTNISVASNNLANASTVGFKKGLPSSKICSIRMSINPVGVLRRIPRCLQA